MSETVQRFWCDGRCSVDAEDGTHVAYEHLERALLALAASQAETLELRRRLDASATGMATLNDRIAAIEAACFAVCRDNTPEAVGEVDPDMGRFVCMSENGTPIIDTDDVVEVIQRMNACWAKQSDLLDNTEHELAHARDRIAELEGALEDVRRVEAWLMELPEIRSVDWDREGGSNAWYYDMDLDRNMNAGHSDSLAALGRMLKGVADAPLSSSPHAHNTEGENG